MDSEAFDLLTAWRTGEHSWKLNQPQLPEKNCTRQIFTLRIRL